MGVMQNKENRLYIHTAYLLALVMIVVCAIYGPLKTLVLFPLFVDYSKSFPYQKYKEI